MWLFSPEVPRLFNLTYLSSLIIIPSGLQKVAKHLQTIPYSHEATSKDLAHDNDCTTTMFLKFTLLALSLSSLTAGLPIHQTSRNTAIQPLDSLAPNISTHALAKRATANPPFDGFAYNQHSTRTDGSPTGDVYRLTKCFCVDTPSRDLPAVYGQYYGHYYGFDYYNYHENTSFAAFWTCASGELESLKTDIFVGPESYYLAPLCLAWQEDVKKQCWETGDGHTFCVKVKSGKDWYGWDGQWRKVHNHPAKEGTGKMPPGKLNEECQRICQTMPANTPGYMLDVVPSDHEHKIELARSTVCTPSGGGTSNWDACPWPGSNTRANPPRIWDTWNYIETYTDQADMCHGCA